MFSLMDQPTLEQSKVARSQYLWEGLFIWSFRPFDRRNGHHSPPHPTKHQWLIVVFPHHVTEWIVVEWSHCLPFAEAITNLNRHCRWHSVMVMHTNAIPDAASRISDAPDIHQRGGRRMEDQRQCQWERCGQCVGVKHRRCCWLRWRMWRSQRRCERGRFRKSTWTRFLRLWRQR